MGGDAHHDHGHHHGQEHGHEPPGGHSHDLRGTPVRRLVIAFAMTAGFMAIEAGVGFWAKSLALVADAGHMLADAAALLLAILAQRIAGQTRTRHRTYGFRRAEVIAAFGNGVALALTALWIFSESIERFRKPEAVQGWPMLVTGFVGLCVNLAAARVLSLGHGHNPNTRAALAHVVYDAVGQVGAMVAAGLILGLGWTRADPVISLAIGVLVLWGGWTLVRDTTRVLMEGSPMEVDLLHVEETIRGVAGVDDLHDLHVWSISEGFVVLTVHVVVAKGSHGIDVVTAVAKRLRDKLGIEHVTIQPEARHDAPLVQLQKRRTAE